MPIEFEGEPAYFVHWLDRTEEAKARQRERQASTVFENSSEAIMVTDAEQQILAVNRAFSEISAMKKPRSSRSRRRSAPYHVMMPSSRACGSPSSAPAPGVRRDLESPQERRGLSGAPDHHQRHG